MSEIISTPESVNVEKSIVSEKCTSTTTKQEDEEEGKRKEKEEYFSKLKLLEEKVKTFERIIIQLAHWTKFDLDFLEVAGFDVSAFKDLKEKVETNGGGTQHQDDESSSSGLGQRSRSRARAAATPTTSKSSKSTSFHPSSSSSIVADVKGRKRKCVGGVKSPSVGVRKSGRLDPNASSATRTLKSKHQQEEEDDDINESREKGSSSFKIIVVKPEPSYSDAEGGHNIESDMNIGEDEDYWIHSSVYASDDDDDEGDSDFTNTFLFNDHNPLDSEDEEEDKNPFVKINKLDKKTLKRLNVKAPARKSRSSSSRKWKGPYQCPKCPSILRTKEQWLEHRKTEHPSTRKQKAYECPKCPVISSTLAERRIHLSQSHKKEKKIYTCEYCGKTTDHKQKHFDHLRVHTGERPYICEICGFATKSNNQLRDHFKMHNDDKPYSCPQCDKTFRRSTEVRVHIRKIHAEDKPLQRQCPICLLVLQDPNKLKRHVEEIHENKRKLICDLCGQAFKRPHHLKKHLERHNNPRRRKRGPQKPMIKTALYPHLIGTRGKEENEDESAEFGNEEDPHISNEEVGLEGSPRDPEETQLSHESSQIQGNPIKEDGEEMEEFVHVPVELIMAQGEHKHVPRDESSEGGDQNPPKNPPHDQEYPTIDSSIVKQFQMDF